MLQTENKNGVITVDESVIVSIVANVAKDCFGIVEMESKNIPAITESIVH